MLSEMFILCNYQSEYSIVFFTLIFVPFFKFLMRLELKISKLVADNEAYLPGFCESKDSQWDSHVNPSFADPLGLCKSLDR